MQKHSIPRWLGIAALIVIAVAFAVVLRATPRFASAIKTARAAERHVNAAAAIWRSTGYRGAGSLAEELRQARVALTQSAEKLGSLAFLQFLPGISQALVYGQQFTGGALRWIDGAAALAEIVAIDQQFFERYADRAPAELTEAERAELFEAASVTLTRARIALDDFDRGDAIFARLGCPRIIRLFTQACRVGSSALNQPELTAVRDGVRSAIVAADSIIAHFGGRTPTTVLLLYLNNTELRPGGGFLGTYGVATVDRGALVDFTTDDVYNLDRAVEGEQRIAPPEPFRRHGIVSFWYLRDANWSPDFSESSRTILDFYRREGGPGDPQVVVGFTPTFAAELLRVVGPVEVGGSRFTAENIADELEYQVEKGYYERGIPRPQRKAIIAPLSRTVIDRLLHKPFREWGSIAAAMRTAIRERQLLAYGRDEALQSVFERWDLAGRVRPLAVGDDGILVVDANLGALKTDSVVERSIRYAIIPYERGYRGTVQLRYRNAGTFTWKTTRYRTYTRVYFPPGTKIIRVSGAMARDRSEEAGTIDQGEELGRRWVGAFLSIEPGQERSLAIEVQLAPDVVKRIRRGAYRFVAQKQLGAIATPLTLDLEFGIPVEAADPPEPPAAWGNSRYSVESDLREDRTFAVRLSR